MHLQLCRSALAWPYPPALCQVSQLEPGLCRQLLQQGWPNAAYLQRYRQRNAILDLTVETCSVASLTSTYSLLEKSDLKCIRSHVHSHLGLTSFSFLHYKPPLSMHRLASSSTNSCLESRSCNMTANLASMYRGNSQVKHAIPPAPQQEIQGLVGRLNCPLAGVRPWTLLGTTPTGTTPPQGSALGNDPR